MWKTWATKMKMCIWNKTGKPTIFTKMERKKTRSHQGERASLSAEKI